MQTQSSKKAEQISEILKHLVSELQIISDLFDEMIRGGSDSVVSEHGTECSQRKMRNKNSVPSIPIRKLSDIGDDLISEKELADRLNLSVRTLKRWRQLREGPDYLRIGRSAAYRGSAVRKWIESTERVALRQKNFGRQR